MMAPMSDSRARYINLEVVNLYLVVEVIGEDENV